VTDVGGFYCSTVLFTATSVLETSYSLVQQNCPLGFTEVIADFIIILRLRFRCRRQRKFEFDHKLNINTAQLWGSAV